jgi:hypothetical protein
LLLQGCHRALIAGVDTPQHAAEGKDRSYE